MPKNGERERERERRRERDREGGKERERLSSESITKARIKKPSQCGQMCASLSWIARECIYWI
jgi:hypothetical protein